MRRTTAFSAVLLPLAACSSDCSTGPGGVRLETPNNLLSVSLNTAIQLSWDPNSRAADPNDFDYYATYSTSYDLDNGTCNDNGWGLEGTSLSEDFLVSGLQN